MSLHHRPQFIRMASRIFEEQLKPSYSFVSMYGPDGVCPTHVDREVCSATIDLMVDTDAKEKPWPLNIYMGETDSFMEITLRPGQAVAYAGHTQRHNRDPMNKASDATFANLVFFHFVHVAHKGPLD